MRTHRSVRVHRQGCRSWLDPCDALVHTESHLVEGASVDRQVTHWDENDGRVK